RLHRIDREERLAIPLHAFDTEAARPRERGLADVERAVFAEGEAVVANIERRAIEEGNESGLELPIHFIIQHAHQPGLVHLTELAFTASSEKNGLPCHFTRLTPKLPAHESAVLPM